MIYICTGFKEICYLPCHLCKCLDTACKSCCQALNESCKGTCAALKSAWAPIVDYPLGSYVIGTWLIQGILGCAAVYGIAAVGKDGCSTDESEDKSSEKSEVQTFCVIFIVFAILHSIFAFYIQRRLVNKLMYGGDTEEEQKKMTLKDVVWYLLKYDIGFCIYFFFAIACPCVALYYTGPTADCTNSKANLGTGAVIFMACLYAVAEFFYMCCFVCGAGAKSTTAYTMRQDIRKSQEQNAMAQGGGPPAETVDQSA